MKRILLIVAALVVSLMAGVIVGKAEGGIAARLIPSNAIAMVGQRITTKVLVSTPCRLGSYSASLKWNPAVLRYAGNSGAPSGFMSVVNATGAGAGRLIFVGANPAGATGNIVVLTVTFDAVGVGASVLDLEFSAMAEAATFRSLLPVLRIMDGRVTVARFPWK